MIVNIGKIYERNILEKYGENNDELFEKDFSPKEREMWEFTLELIKDNYPVKEYDSCDISNYLRNYHSVYMIPDDECEVVEFTLNEWFDYMIKMSD